MKVTLVQRFKTVKDSYLSQGANLFDCQLRLGKWEWNES